MKTFRPFLVLVALVIFLAAPAHAKTDWLDDFEEAQEQAKSEDKLLLVDFTGSDWCSWCIKLDKEVFSKPEFQEYAEENLVLMEADFPRGKKLDEATRRQNEELASKYGVEGFPTLLVFSSEGKKLGELGYLPGGPAAFIAEIEKLKGE